MVQGGTWSTLRLPSVWVSALVFFFLPACAGGDDSAGSPSSTGDVSAETSTTTAGQPSTTTSSAVPVAGLPADAPPLENTGDDYEAIYRSLIDFVNWLGTNPEPGLVELAYHPGSEPYQGALEVIAYRAEEGLRASGPQQTVRAVELRGVGGSGLANMVATLEFPEMGLLDREGAIVQERPGDHSEPARYLISLQRSAGDRWRIQTSEKLVD